jgi:hypothetical protein
LECVVIDAAEHVAACADPKSKCSADDAPRCDDNTAFNCHEGRWAERNCGTAATCEVDGGEAHCHAKAPAECGGHGHLHGDECHCDEGYELASDDPKVCVSDKPFPEAACEAYQGAEAEPLTAGSDPEAAHLHHGERIALKLDPAAKTRAHFDAESAGVHVIFLSAAGILQGASQDGAGVADASSKAGPNPSCPTAIGEHWHLDLDEPGEVVLEFAAAESVELLILEKPE